MDFRIDSKEGLQVLKFVGWELDVMSAAMIEDIHERVKVGNTDSISDYDLSVAKWHSKTLSNEYRTHNFLGIVELLQRFSDRTKDAVLEMPEKTGIPVYKSPEIVERYDWGGRAALLAIAITEKAQDAINAHEMGEEVAADFQQYLQNQGED